MMDTDSMIDVPSKSVYNPGKVIETPGKPMGHLRNIIDTPSKKNWYLWQCNKHPW